MSFIPAMPRKGLVCVRARQDTPEQLPRHTGGKGGKSTLIKWGAQTAWLGELPQPDRHPALNQRARRERLLAFSLYGEWGLEEDRWAGRGT